MTWTCQPLRPNTMPSPTLTSASPAEKRSPEWSHSGGGSKIRSQKRLNFIHYSFRYRRRRRKNRYENLVVPGQDYSEDTLSDNKLYDRDSSYKAPSANYAAPESSYEAPSYSSYEENGKYELKTNSPIQTLCLKQKIHI